MAMIRSANMDAIARDAVVLDLGDLHRQGEALQAQARAKADAIVAQAEAERKRLISSAAEAGKAEGLARGLEEGRAKGAAEGKGAALAEHAKRLGELEAGWARALEQFELEREGMLLGARQDVLRLGVLIAEKVTKRVIEIDASVVASQIEAVLAMLAGPTRLSIAIHPADEAQARESLPRLLARLAPAAHAEVMTDASLAPGSCVARTAGGGSIDASIRTQLDRIIQALLPDGGHGAGIAPPLAMTAVSAAHDGMAA